jgi:malonyl-CoA O-methyltransferase
VPELDARAARRHFERAAATYAKSSRLEAEIGARMLERLEYVKLAPRRILDAGSGPPQDALRGRYPDAAIVALDFAPAMLRMRRRKLFERRPVQAIGGDFARLPFAAGSFQLLWSNMALHWAPDPLAALREFHRVLAVDGLLMLSTLGPDTLAGLREAAGAARVHAFADMHDVGDLLVRSGFADPVMDMEHLTLTYPDLSALLRELRGSGSTNARADAPQGLKGRGWLAGLTRRYEAQRRDGRLPATFEIVYGHAWKPEQAALRAQDGRAIVRFHSRAGS